MENEKILTALKDAMKGEFDSIAVYQNAKHNSRDKEVMKFFDNRANEEKKHYNYLLALYQAIKNYEELKPVKMKEAENLIFSDRFKQEIGKNNLLFSAISVATLLEKNAFDFYQKAAEETDNEILKSFFEKMADWEKHHYDVLLEIADDAKETFWQENRFEPF
ncbi:MAG: ferritin family protein [Candidatus Cloacimonetes bacterium]|nr:ferritin family protein [Candidatus Cloacimonadota bacterium]MCF7814049.1 ferritin family protein [Candidatus Cloacimonadota bacterium]MCF7868649.1 ferritin family protein [Candidatus Cloacimonadota bacterium]MCF7884104.1 ferritin family protein [Candidatus Cloacimonadota bacterium]